MHICALCSIAKQSPLSRALLLAHMEDSRILIFDFCGQRINRRCVWQPTHAVSMIGVGVVKQGSPTI